MQYLTGKPFSVGISNLRYDKINWRKGKKKAKAKRKVKVKKHG